MVLLVLQHSIFLQWNLKTILFISMCVTLHIKIAKEKVMRYAQGYTADSARLPRSPLRLEPVLQSQEKQPIHRTSALTGEEAGMSWATPSPECGGASRTHSFPASRPFSIPRRSAHSVTLLKLPTPRFRPCLPLLTPTKD